MRQSQRQWSQQHRRAPKALDLSWLALGFGIGYADGQEGKAAAEKETVLAELKAKEAENAQRVSQDNAGKSDGDIVKDILRRQP